MDRREFMGASLGLTALGCALPCMACYGFLNDSKSLVLIDSTLAESRLHAAKLQRDNRRFIAVGEDVGMLWHRQLRHWKGTLTGVLRPSDCFVLQTFSWADARAFRTVQAGPHAIAFAIGADRSSEPIS